MARRIGFTSTLAIASWLRGETYTVDRVDDDLASIGCDDATPMDCSLRAAVLAANLNPGADGIVLPDGHYLLTRDGANEDSALTGDLDLRGPVAIQAAPGAHPVIEQTVVDRIFHSSVLVFTGATAFVGPMTLVGGTAAASSGQALGGSIYSFRNGTLSLVDVELLGGTAPDDGGCLYFANPENPGALTLTDVRIAGCAAGDTAGGLFAQVGDSPVTLTRVIVEGNEAGVTGGGMQISSGTVSTVIVDSVFRGNVAGDAGGVSAYGGGIYFTQVPVSLLRSTISGNRAGGATATSGQGGGLFLDNSAVLVQNSTLSGNRAEGTSFALGSAMELSLSEVGLEFTTVVGEASSGWEEIRTGTGSEIDFEASILQARCFATGGVMTSSGLNAERPIGGAPSTTCGLTHPSDVFTTEPLLKPLAGYGGPTPTHALLDAALAVLPAVPADTCNDPVGGPIDQRGAPRTLLFCEPGSFEYGAAAPGAAIFADGFESGNTAAWSAAAG